MEHIEQLEVAARSRNRFARVKEGAEEGRTAFLGSLGEAERAIRRGCSHDEFAEMAFSALDAATVRKAVTANIERLREEPFHYPALLHGPAGALPGFVVMAQEDYEISLYTVNPRRLRQSIARASSPFSKHEGRTIRFDTRIHTVGLLQGCVELTAWRLNEPLGCDARKGAKDLMCSSAGGMRLGVGERARFDATAQTFTIEGLGGSDVLPVVVEVVSPSSGERTIGADYFASTGGFAGAYSTQRTASILQMTSKLFCTYGTDRHRDAVVPLLNHGAHFVRWSAMRDLLLCGHNDALDLLRLMATEDPSEEVRRTASLTLANLRNASGTRD